MSVAGMKIIVTGASSGIGEHIARFLARSGAQVVATARRADRLAAMADEEGANMHSLAMDVADASDVESATAKATEMMGGLDGLFANAGISWGGRAQEMPEEDWARIIDINLNGVFRSCKAAAPIMASNGGGAIVSTASVLSFRPGAGTAAYAASKAGVAHLTKSLALEWASMGVRVNAIAPGYIPTEMTSPFLATEKGQALARNVPMRRFGKPEELEGAIELLLGSKGSFITGVTLAVDGGHLCQSV